MIATDSTYRALLNSVLHDPADDAPRLILADYLDEHGQAERAELIRVQVELARRIAPGLNVKAHVDSLKRVGYTKATLGDWPELERLEDQSRELLAAHGERWAMDELVRPCGIRIGGAHRVTATGIEVAWHDSEGEKAPSFNTQVALVPWLHLPRRMHD